MMKKLLAGLTLTTVAAFPLAIPHFLANAQESVFVTTQCPQATWMENYFINEFMPLSPTQVKKAEVFSNTVNVRTGAGFVSPIAFTLDKGEQVDILGEAWDRGCHQWMKVFVTGVTGEYWIRGDLLEDRPTGRIFAPPSPRVIEQCPQASWMRGVVIGEKAPLARADYRAARVRGNGVNVRLGAGLEAEVEATANLNTPVLVSGEAWDRGCNQWMEVEIEGRSGRWIHGEYIQYISELDRNSASNNRVSASPNTLGVGGIGEGPPPESFRPRTPVISLCPQATWTAGYYIHELIPLAASQYRSAIVAGDRVQARRGAGFAFDSVTILERGEPVIVTGEAWDQGCNQWMQVQARGRRNWIHGDLLQNL